MYGPLNSSSVQRRILYNLSTARLSPFVKNLGLNTRDQVNLRFTSPTEFLNISLVPSVGQIKLNSLSRLLQMKSKFEIFMPGIN